MKRSTYFSLFAQVTTMAALVGCLPADMNRSLIEPCDDNAATALSACAELGLRAVSRCPDTDFGTCREVAFYNGCDQLEVALCAGNEDCAEPAMGIGYRVEDICAEHGLVPASQNECDWIETVETGRTEDADDAMEPVVVDAVGGGTTDVEENGDETDSESGFTTKCGDIPDEMPEPIAPASVCFEVELPSVCGWSDFVLCKEPDVMACPEIYDPVCGVDGVTYENRCAANGVVIAHQGECEAPCPFLFEPVCGVDGINYTNECFARARRIPIAHEGECVPLERGSCIDDGILSGNSTVRISIEHRTDTVEVPRENEDAEAGEEAPSALTIAAENFTNIRVRMDARQRGAERRDANPRFIEKDIQVRSFTLYTGARFEDFEELLVEEGASEAGAPIQLIDTRAYAFDGYLEGRFVAEFRLRVGNRSCTFRGEVDTELDAQVDALRNQQSEN